MVFELEDLENLDIEGECVALPNDGEPCATSLCGDVCNVNQSVVRASAPREPDSPTCSSDVACYSVTATTTCARSIRIQHADESQM